MVEVPGDFMPLQNPVELDTDIHRLREANERLRELANQKITEVADLESANREFALESEQLKARLRERDILIEENYHPALARALQVLTELSSWTGIYPALVDHDGYTIDRDQEYERQHVMKLASEAETHIRILTGIERKQRDGAV